MKPTLFRSPAELVTFIQNLPTPEGEARVRGSNESINARTALDRCMELVEPIFAYRKRLAKGLGGIGSNKALNRYVELIAENGPKVHVEEYEAAIIALDVEIENLMTMGASDTLGEQLRTAKTKVEQFKMMKAIIEGFIGKLQGRMEVVESRYGKLVSELEEAGKLLQKSGNVVAKDAVKTALEEIKNTHSETQALIEKMHEYGGLQIAYNAILLGAA